MKIGEINKLTVKKILKSLYILEDESGNTVELYKNEPPAALEEGEQLEVFVVNDKQACYGQPKAIIGDFAALKVNSVQDFGVFLDWGLSKDLFVPGRNLMGKPKIGDTLVVYLIPDFEGSGVLGTMYFRDFIRMDTEKLVIGEKYPMLVWEKTPLGYNIIIDNKYSGLAYNNEVFKKLEPGDSLEGYIKNIREDGGVDVSIQPIGFNKANESAEEIILCYLETSGGFAPLHDKSAPEDIYAALELSKKNFKRAVGTLYKAGKISIKPDGISLTKP
jgi:uncharacterized protein